MTGDHWQLKANPWSDQPRFYPPGQHPATHRQRQQLEKMRQLRERVVKMAARHGHPPNVVTLDECIAYVTDTITAFEARESELKARAYYEQRTTP